ncbi:MAG: hypothetical protein CL678_18355 [Bdellovibrionaceae bacterium]|nr:hypothetical protein [Pseudobdellovibrionaceae bacterium]|tara:strand:- start:202 stop:2655 length:2454 start_codon:yes stop_codon:yes gene_type:complete
MKLVKTFSRLIQKYAVLISLIGLGISVYSGFYTVELYKNLRTELEELLPTTARSVIDLDEIKNRLNSTDNLAVLIFSPDTKASKRFVDDLARELKKVPPEIIAGIEYKIDRELKYFENRRAIYMDTRDLKKIRDYIRDRINYEKELYNPLNIFSSRELSEPSLDLLALKKKYDLKTSSFSKFPEGYYATDDETLRVALINLPGKNSGVEGMMTLKKEVLKAIKKLNPSRYSKNIEIKYTGGVQNVIEEQASLIADLELSTVIVVVITTLAMLLYFGTFWATFALLGSLLFGTLWTFGLAYFMVGYLNANTAFLGAIVIGNGINFGIMLLARYIEERKQNQPHITALELAMSKTTTATWTAALAAGLAYGSLMLTSFRGFNQFGKIGLTGMVLCWISAFTLLPAYLTLLHRWKLLKIKKRNKIPAFFTQSMIYLVRHWPRGIWITAVLLTTGSMYLVVTNKTPYLETNLAKLRDKKSMESGSGYLTRYLDQVFDRDLSPVVILTKTTEEATTIREKIEAKIEKEGEETLIAGVRSLADFLPKNQEENFKIAKEIRERLPNSIIEQLPLEQRKQAKALIESIPRHRVTPQDLPPLVRQKFREKDGSIGKLVLVEPPLKSAFWSPKKLNHFISDLREITDSVSPGSPVAGQLPITSDMLESIQIDGPKATLFAFLAVCLLVVLLFRNLNTIIFILFALLLGVSWLAGLILLFDWKINFLNFIALPITFGIGVDYGVNIFQRYRLERKKTILHVIRDTGGAVGLASLTTIVGYGSLILASNQAFVSFGVLAVAGEITCLLAAILALPAYIRYRNLKRLKTR